MKEATQQTKTETPKTLAGKLAAVAAALGSVRKDGRNDHFQYSYVTAASIFEAVRGALSANGVAVVPSVQQVDQLSPTMVRLWLRLLWIDTESGETIEAVWVGDGMDKGDKALYKAYTGTMKYAMIETFQIPTGDDPEQEDEPAHVTPLFKEPDWIDDATLTELASVAKVNLTETLAASGKRLQQLTGADRRKLADWLKAKGGQGQA